MPEVIAVHVAWNDRHGNPDRLCRIEFGGDCEICAVETDVLNGDPVIIERFAFTMFLNEEARKSGRGSRFAFHGRNTHTGNIMWDTIYMMPDQFAKLGEFIQSQNHWSLDVAADPFWHSWGSLSAESFLEMYREVSRT